jgi:hypothetical protein
MISNNNILCKLELILYIFQYCDIPNSFAQLYMGADKAYGYNKLKFRAPFAESQVAGNA